MPETREDIDEMKSADKKHILICPTLPEEDGHFRLDFFTCSTSTSLSIKRFWGLFLVFNLQESGSCLSGVFRLRAWPYLQTLSICSKPQKALV